MWMQIDDLKNKNKIGKTIGKLQGAVTEQGASIAALTATAKNCRPQSQI